MKKNRIVVVYDFRYMDQYRDFSGPVSNQTKLDGGSLDFGERDGKPWSKSNVLGFKRDKKIASKLPLASFEFVKFH